MQSLHRFSKLYRLLFVPAITLGMVTSVAATTPDNPSLAPFVNESGELKLPDGFSGTLDGSGFRLQSAPGQAPRFQPMDRSAEPTGQWLSPGAVAYGCNGYVRTSTIGPDGRLYFGGQFTVCGGTVVNGIAVYDPTTGEISPLTPPGEQIGVNWYVSAMAFINGDLYIGGAFERIGDVAANHVARWDGTHWHALGQGTANGVNSLVSSVVEYQGDVVFGGAFDTAGDTNAFAIARWTGEEWSTLSGASGPLISGRVVTMKVIGGDLYIGGRIWSGGFQNIARWDGNSLHPLGDATTNGPNDYVSAIEEHQGDVYVGGPFTEVNGIDSVGLARWDGNQWNSVDTGFEHSIFPIVYDLMSTPEGLVTVGRFSRASGIEVNHVAIWDGIEFLSVGAGLNIGFDDLALTIAGTSSDFYVGGQFSTAGGQLANQIVHWDGADWSRLSEVSGEGISGEVTSILMTDHGMYVGGQFRSAGEVGVVNVAYWNGTDWDPLGLPDENWIFGNFSVMAHDGTYLYAAGVGPKSSEGQLAANIFRWDGLEWTPMESGIYGTTRVLAAVDGVIYKGGSFTDNGQPYTFGVGYWDGEQWQPLGPGDYHPEEVRAIAAHDGQLAVAGRFVSPTFNEWSSIGVWTGEEWIMLPFEHSELPGGFVNDIAGAPEGLYAAGSFVGIGSALANKIALWDGSQWNGLSDGAYTGVNQAVNSISHADGNLYITGAFSRAGRVPASHIAKWDGHRWFALGDGRGSQGISHSGLALDARAGTVAVGGRLSMAGGKTAASLAWFEDDSIGLLFADGFGGGSVAGLDHLAFDQAPSPNDFLSIQSPFLIGDYELLFDQDYESRIYGEERLENPMRKQILEPRSNREISLRHQQGERIELMEFEFGILASSSCQKSILGLSGIRDGEEVIYQEVPMPVQQASYWNTIRLQNFDDLDEVVFRAPCEFAFFLSSLRVRSE